MNLEIDWVDNSSDTMPTLKEKIVVFIPSQVIKVSGTSFMTQLFHNS